MKAQDLREEITSMINALNTMTHVVAKPEDLVNEDGDWIDEKPYELPHAFVLDKWDHYISCFVNKIDKGTAYLTGLYEDAGDDFECKVDELPVNTILDLVEICDIDFDDYAISTSDGHDEEWTYYKNAKEAYDTFEYMKSYETDIHLFMLNERHEYEVIDSWVEEDEE